VSNPGSARLVSESWLGSFQAKPKKKARPARLLKMVRLGSARLEGKVGSARIVDVRLVCQLSNSCWL
jgi:hypothetical protein